MHTVFIFFVSFASGKLKATREVNCIKEKGVVMGPFPNFLSTK